MSESAALLDNPFDVAALDENTELMALANALRLADGFRLFFVRCNQPNQRLRLMAKLGLQLPQDTFFYVHLTEPTPHLLDTLRAQLPESPPRALFVSGLEYSLPVADEAENTSFIANLNASRNSFPSTLPCPLVLWLPEYALTAIVRGAPDFFSIRSGVYFFAASLEETEPLFEAVNSGDNWQLANLPLLEKQERAATIESLLQDYQVLTPDKRDYWAEARLLDRLGHLYKATGRWKLAEMAYQQSLEICRELGDRQGEGATLNNLGIVYRNQGWWTEAEQAHQQALQICRDVGDRNGEGATLNNLGNFYQAQGRWVEAEQTYQQALQICHELGTRQDEGGVLGNLALVKEAEGKIAEAIEFGRAAINVLLTTEDTASLKKTQSWVEEWERLVL